MSGGSLDYLCYKIENAIDTCFQFEISDYQYVNGKGTDIYGQPVPKMTYHAFRTKDHVRFYKHLQKVAQALHDLEWAMDGDIMVGEELKSIKQVLRKTRRTK